MHNTRAGRDLHALAALRKSPKISEVLPLLYLHGLSSGDFVPALEQSSPLSGPEPASSAATS